MNNIKSEIVAHSINKQGDELISILATFPRIILAEVNTHRMLSKNTSSSRAIPFEKMLEAVKNNPFIPIAWQKDHKGMQGTEYITDELELRVVKDAWNFGKMQTITNAKRLYEANVTKQLANRLLEPYMWTTMLITGPKEGWENFFELRCPNYEIDANVFGIKNFKSKKVAQEYCDMNGVNRPHTDLDWLKANAGQAEIHMMDLAEKIWDSVNESTPVCLQAGQWHIPFINNIVKSKILGDTTTVYNIDGFIPDAVKISTAMGARTSYTVVGEEKAIDFVTLVGLHDRLINQNPPHSSPSEHCAQCMDDDEYQSFIKGEFQVTHSEPGYEDLGDFSDDSKGWCRNFKGFKPYRFIIENK